MVSTAESSLVSLIIAGVAVVAVLLFTSLIITTFLRSVDAGVILLASRGRNLQIFRGPCKALVVPVITQVRFIPAQAINVDIEITDQTADVDTSGRSAPVKVTVRASAKARAEPGVASLRRRVSRSVSSAMRARSISVMGVALTGPPSVTRLLLRVADARMPVACKPFVR